LPYNKAGQAALKGKEQKIKIEYKHWNVLGNNFTNQFYIVAVKHSVLFLRKTSHIFSVHSSSPMNLLTQQLSVAIHTIRAIQFEAIKGVQVFEERRIQPTVN